MHKKMQKKKKKILRVYFSVNSWLRAKKRYKPGGKVAKEYITRKGTSGLCVRF